MIVVTGGSGFLGKYVLRKLIKEGYEVLNLINKTPSNINGVKEIKIENYSEDFFVKITKGADIVIHIAAALGGVKKDYDYFYKVNTLFPLNIAKASIINKSKQFIYISSAGIYGKGIKKGEIDEKFPPSPTDNYEKTKFLGEQKIIQLKDNIKIKIIRPGWIYGPGDKRTLKLFKMINKGYFFIAGKGDSRQSPVFVEDLAEGIILLMKKQSMESGEIFNMASDEIITTEKMIKTIAKTLNKKILPFKIPLPPLKILAKTLDIIFKPFNFSPPLTVSSLAFFERSKPLSIKKAKRMFGFSPKTKFKEGMQKTIENYKQEGLL